MIHEFIRESVTDDVDAVLFIGSVETADRLVDWLRGWVPADIPDEILAAIAGWLMVKYGDRLHPKIKPVGAGLMVRAIGAYVGSIFETIIGSLPART